MRVHGGGPGRFHATELPERRCRIIRVPCTGKVDVLHILRCFETGRRRGLRAWAAVEGDCHYHERQLPGAKARGAGAGRCWTRSASAASACGCTTCPPATRRASCRFAEEMHATDPGRRAPTRSGRRIEDSRRTERS
ncbi:MAG: hydrogenase iron-sulfur subunit [Desulfosudis oleivorans]|nr:hydrogenase iron-sulfur subunit [Desulfosudis oleivorans]